MNNPKLRSAWIDISENIIRVDDCDGAYVYATVLFGPDAGTRYEQTRLAISHFQPGGLFRPYTGRLVK